MSQRRGLLGRGVVLSQAHASRRSGGNTGVPAATSVNNPGCHPGMVFDLFAGIPVTDYAAALVWYQRLFGSAPSVLPQRGRGRVGIGDHRWVCIVQRPEYAGHAMHTILVDDLDARVTPIAERGLEPTEQETYENGMRKTTYCDPDGNEIGFGCAAG